MRKILPKLILPSELGAGAGASKEPDPVASTFTGKGLNVKREPDTSTTGQAIEVMASELSYIVLDDSSVWTGTTQANEDLFSSVDQGSEFHQSGSRGNTRGSCGPGVTLPLYS